MRRPLCRTKTDWWTWGPRSLKYPPLVWRMTRETMLMTALMTLMMRWRHVTLHLWATLHSSLGTAPASHRRQLAATQPRLPGIVFRNQWPRFVDFLLLPILSIFKTLFQLLFMNFKWARDVPSFQQLSSHNQKILLQHSWSQLLVLSLAQLPGTSILQIKFLHC